MPNTYSTGTLEVTNGLKVAKLTGGSAIPINMKLGDLIKAGNGTINAIEAMNASVTPHEIIFVNPFDGTTAPAAAYFVVHLPAGWGSVIDLNEELAEEIRLLGENIHTAEYLEGVIAEADARLAELADTIIALGLPAVNVAQAYLRRTIDNAALEYLTPAQVLLDIGAQAALSVPAQAEVEAGTGTTPRSITAQRIFQAIDARAFNGKVLAKTGAYTIVKADQGALITVSSATPVTISLTAASTLGSKFLVGIKNIGAGTVTIDPAGTEQLDGAATDVLITNEAVILDCDGTNFNIIAERRKDGSDLSGMVKSQVGLANVDNTSDANKPVSTAGQTALDLKAPLASPAFTGTPTGITKTHVGLPNVDNTSDVNKPVSTAQQTALNLKANSASPTLTGVPLAPTAALGTNTTQIATMAALTAAINAIIGGAGPGYDTFLELQALMEADDTDAAAMLAAIALKAPIANPAFTGTVSGITKAMVGLGSVDNTTDAAKPVSTLQAAAIAAKASPSDILGYAEVILTANTAITLATHNKKVIAANSATPITLSLGTPAALTLNFFAIIANVNVGDTTVTGSFDDGSTSIILQKGQSLIVSSNGSTIRTLLRGGGAGLSGDELVLTANASILRASAGKDIIGNSATAITLTLDTPTNLGAKWMSVFGNINTGDVILSGTFDDGTTSLTLEKGQSVLVQSNGTVHRLLLRGASKGTVVPLSESGLGDGSPTITLTNTPAGPDAILLFIGGAVQAKGTYSIAGNVITAGGNVATDEKWVAFHLKGGAASLGQNTVYGKYTGTGSAGPFPLPANPATFNAADFTFGGLTVPKDGLAYTLNLGANPVTVTFSEAVPATSYWEVEVKQTFGIGTPNAETVGANELKASDVAAVRTKLNVAPQQASILDTTAGAGLVVGSFGLGGYVSLGAIDLNGVVTTGFYYCSGSTNSPGSNGWLLVQGLNSATFATQTYTVLTTGAVYTRRLSTTWTPWRLSYSTDNVLGTVSQSSGVPTGAIIEAGSNSNGNYTKWADGTMICWFVDQVTNQAITTAYGSLFQGTRGWTFPSAFISPPSLSCGVFRWGSGASWPGTAGNASATAAVLRVWDNVTRATGTATDVAASAVGRWY